MIVKKGRESTLREKGVKRDINYYFSRATTMPIAAETILCKYVIGKV